MLVRSGMENKAEKVGPWRSRERVVVDGKLLYAVGTLIPREEAVRQGLIPAEESSTKDTKDTKDTKGRKARGSA